MSASVDLSSFRNASFERGRSFLIEITWRITSAFFFQSSWFPCYRLKRVLLRAFGAKIGRGVLIKPRVTITFPWKVSVGNHSWIGEEVWLDSLDRIDVGANACVSQRAYLCTGSHSTSSPTFDLITKPITLEDGAWVGAACSIGPGVRIGTHAFVMLGSVVTEDVPANTVVSGNPAQVMRERKISS